MLDVGRPASLDASFGHRGIDTRATARAALDVSG